MFNEDSLAYIKTAILVPSVLSFLTSLTLALILHYNHARKTPLSSFVLAMMIADSLYSCTSIFFSFDTYFTSCNTLISLTREYLRLVSCLIAVAFAYTISKLARSVNSEVSPRFHSKCFMYILFIPSLFVIGFALFTDPEYLDVLCWGEVLTPDPDSSQEIVELFLKLPLVVTFLSTFLLYYSVIVTTKRKMESDGNVEFTNKLYELLVYPLGILICYLWFFFDTAGPDDGLVRIMDVIFQQLQGLVNFFIFGMNYQTRTMMKDYWQQFSNKIYEFMHLREKEMDIEMQTMPLNLEYTASTRERFRNI